MTDAMLAGQTRAWQRVARGLVAVAAAATLTTWVQLAIVAIRRDVIGSFSWKWWLRDQLFLSAAGYLLVFAALSFVPLLAFVLWPRRYSMSRLVATLAGMGTFLVLLLFEEISWMAWTLVAIGVGMQLYRAATGRPEGLWRWTWRVALVGNLATVLVVVARDWLNGSREAAAIAGLPAPAPGTRNILLVVMDTERARSMSLYGAPQATTPNLASRGQQGVVFDGAHSTSSWTLPSHTSMFTGRYPSRTTADWLSPLDGAAPTLAEVLREHGYGTGGFVANMNFVGYQTGLARGFLHFSDSKRSLWQILLGTTLMQSGSVARALETWDRTHWRRETLRAAFRPIMLHPQDGAPEMALNRADGVAADFLAWRPTLQGRPFFAFLNLFDAHGPYLPPPRYRTMFDSAGGNYGRYLGGIRYVDDTIEKLLVELDRQGVLQQTIVIITSDHGELFGEHKLIGHGNGLYEPQLHVPLVILNAPGARPGTRVRQNVSLRDLPATLLDLAAVPNTRELGGTSLRPLLEGVASLPSASPVLSELSPSFNVSALKVVKSPLKSLLDDSSHVLVDKAGSVRLFGFPADSAEAHDLATSPERRTSAGERMRQAMRGQGISWNR